MIPFFVSFQEIAGDVPLKVINDGEVTALAAVQKIKAGNVMGISMGSSEGAGSLARSAKVESCDWVVWLFIDQMSFLLEIGLKVAMTWVFRWLFSPSEFHSGYANADGNLMGWISELCYCRIDLNPKAPTDPWSKGAHRGLSHMCLGWSQISAGLRSQVLPVPLLRYLGQRGTTKLAAKGGVEVPANYKYPHADMCTIKHENHAQCLDEFALNQKLWESNVQYQKKWYRNDYRSELFDVPCSYKFSSHWLLTFGLDRLEVPEVDPRSNEGWQGRGGAEDLRDRWHLSRLCSRWLLWVLQDWPRDDLGPCQQGQGRRYHARSGQEGGSSCFLSVHLDPLTTYHFEILSIKFSQLVIGICSIWNPLSNVSWGFGRGVSSVCSHQVPHGGRPFQGCGAMYCSCGIARAQEVSSLEGPKLYYEPPPQWVLTDSRHSQVFHCSLSKALQRLLLLYRGRSAGNPPWNWCFAPMDVETLTLTSKSWSQKT